MPVFVVCNVFAHIETIRKYYIMYVTLIDVVMFSGSHSGHHKSK